MRHVRILLAVALLGFSAYAPNRAEAGYHYVGERVYATANDAYATILAVQFDGTYVLQFLSGPLAGQTGTGWRDQDLATLAGCSGDLCVNMSAYNISRDAFVQVVGIQYDQGYVVTFTSGTLAGQTGHGWTRSDLAQIQGCLGDLCVGQEVYNLSDGYTCAVAGYDVYGSYVLRFDTGPFTGQYGHGWLRSQLNPIYNPPPPSGMTTCILTTQMGQYSGSGYSQGQASAAAHDQCLRVETSFSCNAGSLVCHQ
jgi:hypothetical protein